MEWQEMRLKTETGARASRNLVGCMSKNNGKTMNGWKHEGNMMTSAYFFNHCDFNMKKYIK